MEMSFRPMISRCCSRIFLARNANAIENIEAERGKLVALGLIQINAASTINQTNHIRIKDLVNFVSDESALNLWYRVKYQYGP